jgi:hypothetical protein
MPAGNVRAVDAASRLRKVGIVMRITERAVRTYPLNEWALWRRVDPDGGNSEVGFRRMMPDKGSSLAFDDLDFMADLDNFVVSSTARYPVMSATDNLVGAAQSHTAAFQENRTNIAAVVSLCRCALEASAKTIWLLADPSRKERRARSLGFTQSERQPEQSFHRIEERVFAARSLPASSPEYKSFQQHRAEYDRRAALIAAIPKTEKRKPGNYSDFVTWSAKWIDANPAPHVADQSLLGMELGSDRFYSYASSFVHGFKWMTDYVHDDEDTLIMLADGFAAAVIMTECAVALFEAQSTHPARLAIRSRNIPNLLIPTVEHWAPRYWE